MMLGEGTVRPTPIELGRRDPHVSIFNSKLKRERKRLSSVSLF